jgi:hypothetical protein
MEPSNQNKGEALPSEHPANPNEMKNNFSGGSGERSAPATAIRFFDRKSLINSKKRPKPIIYQIFLCSRCLEDNSRSSENQISGAWAVLIQRCPQDGMTGTGQTAYLVSGVEKAIGNIELRLRGLKEAMIWMSSSVDKANWPYIDATLLTSDIFLVNLLREWLPKWAKKNFSLSANSTEKRPHAELLAEIAEVSTVAKVTVEWHPYHSPQMQEVNKKVDSILMEDGNSN